MEFVTVMTGKQVGRQVLHDRHRRRLHQRSPERPPRRRHRQHRLRDSAAGPGRKRTERRTCVASGQYHRLGLSSTALVADRERAREPRRIKHFRDLQASFCLTPVEHGERVMVEFCRFTAPLRARARPSRVAAVLRVMLASAMMVPTKVVPVPRFVELRTCQNTLQACAPFCRTTLLPEPVIKVDAA